ncbi:hypothetical protein [Haloarcula salina]|uniref:Uncharacterized protein n=1 Tax=Haloarcula salina TaxID=1429914 RepID=A0AA41FZQ6_9EURY|nr:hypothetical protein [Haloarcula salina]MBV0901596.1 hypothetical protein [Haloarcula salina]
MIPDGRRYVLATIRGVLVLSGLVVTVAVLYSFASMPASTAEHGGFVRGLAYLFGSALFLLALGGIGLGIVLPSLLGTGERFGFGHWQWRCLQGAGGLFLGGFAVGLAIGLITQLQLGLLVWFVAIVLGAFAVSGVLAWRLFEVFVDAVARLVAEEAAD